MKPALAPTVSTPRHALAALGQWVFLSALLVVGAGRQAAGKRVSRSKASGSASSDSDPAQPSHPLPGHAAALWQATRAVWLPFVLVSTLVGAVLIRIVVVTASSYGLNELAVGAVIRVLVIELLPLAAALTVWLRFGLASSEAVRKTARRYRLQHGGWPSPATWMGWVAPRVWAGSAVVVLAALSSAALLVVFTYLMMHGPTPWALGGFVRSFGQVFSPAVSVILVVKTWLFAWAVAWLPPLAALTHGLASARVAQRWVTQHALAVVGVLLAGEILALLGNYY